MSDLDVKRALAEEFKFRCQEKGVMNSYGDIEPREKTVVVGSRAMRYWFNDYRKDKEVQWTDYYYISGGKGPLPQYFPGNAWRIDVKGKPGMERFLDSLSPIAPVSYLYALALAKSQWNVKWERTMEDLLYFQRKNIKPDLDLYKLLLKDWKTIYGERSSHYTLDKPVKRIYSHNDLHKAVAYHKNPLYYRIMSGPWTSSKSLFDNLSHLDQVRLCREEIYAVALEYFLIPRNFEIDVLTAYREACRLLLTRLTGGWFPLFIAMNWDALKEPDHLPFVDQYTHELVHGRIKKI